MNRALRCVGGCLCAGAFVLSGLPSALADDISAVARAVEHRLYFYTGTDIATDNSYGWAGAAWAPFAPMDAEGLRLRVQGGIGQYDYRNSALPGGWNTVNKTEGEALVGWQFLSGPHALALYGGAAMIENRLQLADPDNPDQGTAYGAKLLAEWYGRLQPDLIATAAAGFTSADRTATVRLTAAKVLENGWEVGAEGKASTDRLSTEAGAGAFVNLPAFGNMLRIAGGWRWNTDAADGPYGTLSLYRAY
ncbi:cellulose biosynthesis protein BcsS [Ancylobacter sp. 6x-1]|uniref:Cellulose biosynthesis protein BcsS n=1 Tax=Ancylobacter crimeensis TaxID=2579147 RepID=A0ABT0DFR0_9HYPH|nr:cellulose biosynthesis protein BcsS [Ancylobacter crimeensis]MCK0198807.1 cellulose biosynthesis protein BcsS [Ancylobacter crimeensis]